MKVLKQLSGLLRKKSREYNPEILFLSPLEMNTVFGGKPEEKEHDARYWWIEDDALPVQEKEC